MAYLTGRGAWISSETAAAYASQRSSTAECAFAGKKLETLIGCRYTLPARYAIHIRCVSHREGGGRGMFDQPEAVAALASVGTEFVERAMVRR